MIYLSEMWKVFSRMLVSNPRVPSEPCTVELPTAFGSVAAFVQPRAQQRFVALAFGTSVVLRARECHRTNPW